MQEITRLDMHVVAIARSKPLYSDGQFMRKIGDTYDCEKNVAYEFDYIVRIVRDKGVRKCIVEGQRCADKERFLPQEFNLNEAMSLFYSLMKSDNTDQIADSKSAN